MSNQLSAKTPVEIIGLSFGDAIGPMPLLCGTFISKHPR
jgi:hypothetical protein